MGISFHLKTKGIPFPFSLLPQQPPSRATSPISCNSPLSLLQQQPPSPATTVSPPAPSLLRRVLRTPSVHRRMARRSKAGSPHWRRTGGSSGGGGGSRLGQRIRQITRGKRIPSWSGVSFNGTFPVLFPWPIANPTRSPNRLGSAFGNPILDVDALEVQLFPKMSPTMEEEGFESPDLAAGAGWCVQEGLLGATVHEVVEEGGEGEGFFWSLRGRLEEEVRVVDPISKSKL